MSQNSYVVFIYPEDNRRIREGAEMAVNRIITSEFKSNIRPVTWEDIFNEITQHITIRELRDQYAEFRRKYFIEQKEDRNLLIGRKRVKIENETKQNKINRSYGKQSNSRAKTCWKHCRKL